ncbi:thiamine pyrophosphate-binding protein [Halorussus salinisoli]|uniref:thiamine pyrophosphate-binding protein n=1 Tax=Halorussus salinisoli TaxID=2558242 RepID=UPI0010C23F2A|nr:thiamine pyrophosphate-binding protein [Halorussus salinisoli]
MATHRESRTSKPGGDHVYDALVDAGIELLVGLPGTQTLPLDRVVAERSEMEYVMARHETSIPHIAWGYYEASGKPAATLTVPGPGDTNAMHGLKNASEDCVPIIHISADIDPADRGKGPIHEIEADTYDNVVKANVNVETEAELSEKVGRAIEYALTPPYGPVRIGVPSSLLEATFEASTVSVTPETIHHDNETAYADAVDALTNAERPIIYVGGGARRSSGAGKPIENLAETLDAPVLSSYKGKGVFPEDDPRFLGVTAKHLPNSAKQVLDAADTVLALGTDFDGITTANWELPMGEMLIHVNLDPTDIDAAYDSDIAIVDDATHASKRLLKGIRRTTDRSNAWNGAELASKARTEYVDNLEEQGLLADSPVNTPGALRTIRDAIPRESIVTTDIGGFRLWSKQVFEAYNQQQYITAGSWAGMGVGLPAALGAKLAHPDDPVVSLTGDGGLMMCLTELHTAAEHGLNVVVVVFNNCDYGVISKSPKIDQYADGHRFEWGSPDFASIAEGFGCQGIDVDSRTSLRNALTDALDAEKPTVINVDIPSDEQSVVEASQYSSAIEPRQ